MAKYKFSVNVDITSFKGATLQQLKQLHYQIMVMITKVLKPHRLQKFL